MRGQRVFFASCYFLLFQMFRFFCEGGFYRPKTGLGGPGRALKNFLEVARFILAEYKPVGGHGDLIAIFSQSHRTRIAIAMQSYCKLLQSNRAVVAIMLLPRCNPYRDQNKILDPGLILDPRSWILDPRS